MNTRWFRPLRTLTLGTLLLTVCTAPLAQGGKPTGTLKFGYSTGTTSFAPASLRACHMSFRAANASALPLHARLP